MALWLHGSRIPALAAFFCLCCVGLRLQAETAPARQLEVITPATATNLEERLRQLERNQAALVEQNRQLSLRLKNLQGSPQANAREPSTRSSIQGVSASTDPPDLVSDAGTTPLTTVPGPSATGEPALTLTPITKPGAGFHTEQETSTENVGETRSQSSATYDDGLVFRLESEEFPFELKINGQNQIRYTAFGRTEETWTDSAGNVSPIVNRSAFELPRGRLIFTGHVFQPELLYDLNIDYNTVSSSQINFRSYWLGWRFDKAFTLYAGQNKVPGGREWLTSSTRALGPDRSMATTFFRPSLSQGIWAMGEPEEGLHYHVMMSNGFNTLGSTPDELNSRMTFSGSTWVDPLGEYGSGYSDYEYHETAAIRLGTSLTYARVQGPQGSTNVPENSEVRFSDGTVITETGAIAPGMTLNEYDIALASFDFAYKYRGFNFSTEFYLQDLLNFQANGPLPRTSVFQYGGFAQIGSFVIPKKLELYARTSHVTGPYGTGSEYAGGLNWFILPDKDNLRWTLDVANLDRSPASQNRTDYLAGQSGWLVRSQVQIVY